MNSTVAIVVAEPVTVATLASSRRPRFLVMDRVISVRGEHGTVHKVIKVRSSWYVIVDCDDGYTIGPISELAFKPEKRKKAPTPWQNEMKEPRQLRRYKN